MANSFEDEMVRRRQYLDQQEEEIVQNMSRLWRRMYCQLVEEGFNEPQALSLLFHFMQITYHDGG